MNQLIRLREAMLGLVIGKRANDVLNRGPAAATVVDGGALAGAIKRAVNQFKALAMDETGTQVDYDRLRDHPAYQTFRHELTPQLQTFDPTTLPDRATRLAFWINLYNALVIDAVIAFAVKQSVADELAGLSFFQAAAYLIGGQRCSLNDIEHGILRANRGHPFIPGPQFAADDPRLAWLIDPPDPRIHFALNCASRSCPPIAVYSADQIDHQLDMALRHFVATDVTVDPERGEIHVSRIFDRYREDFGGLQGIVQLLRHALPDDERRAWLLQTQRGRFVFRPYNWALNHS
ncbi:DUF547 domain-containing protein [Chloroflexus aggregans]|uniref:DUF547 domain-containing protein n=1 Tax=Chloroflexus aggregans (strain MD-66 / DSM 9485) TaxID=326427 RepID=B8GC91_CHLAD|nr:DUF547 domain-containing protein [Chloroflexus aggregans]ACL23065.1 protein of unknown function DUF547 [Chloroflexus aggregans DSM 9485]